MIHIERRKGKGECKRACFLLPIIPDYFVVPVLDGSISDNPLVSPVRTGGGAVLGREPEGRRLPLFTLELAQFRQGGGREGGHGGDNYSGSETCLAAMIVPSSQELDGRSQLSLAPRGWLDADELHITATPSRIATTAQQSAPAMHLRSQLKEGISAIGGGNGEALCTPSGPPGGPCLTQPC
jgi:hypothetical protein